MHQFNKLLGSQWIKDFDPEFILVSGGFDAHGHDAGVCGVGGLMSEDYGTIMRTIMAIANQGSCNGRVVVAMEGGYGVEGGPLGTLARSALAMVSPHDVKDEE